MFRIILALLIFGCLITIHECGHYAAARIFKVGIREFSIGMGPKIRQIQSKKTGIAYTLRLLPIGGYVSMDGEDDDSESEFSLNRKPKWQRFIVLAAGAMMNILLGLILTFALILSEKTLGTNVVHSYPDGVSAEDRCFLPDDIITKVDGVRVYTAYDLCYMISHRGAAPVDVTVSRDGQTLTIEDVSFPVISENGMAFGCRNFYLKAADRSAGTVIRHTINRSLTFSRMIIDSLVDLVRGRYGIEDMSGPVGVTTAISDASRAEDNGVSLLSLTALLTLNLGIFNLLPFPALDGGRILFLLIEAIRRKPMRREIEGYINFAGLALLMLLMVIVTASDVTKLF